MLNINLVKGTGRSFKLLICFLVLNVLGFNIHKSYAQVAFIGYDYESGTYPLPWTLAPTVFNAGTAKEVGVIPDGGAIKTAQICSPTNNNISHYELNSSNTQYIEIQIKDHASAQYLVQFTGSSSNDDEAIPPIAFSDKSPFDPASVLSVIESPSFPGRADAWKKIQITPPSSAKSMRLYRRIDYYAGFNAVSPAKSGSSGRTQPGNNKTFRLASVAVYATAVPTQQTQNIVFSGVNTSAMTISFTRGNGTHVAVFAKEGAGPISNPVDNTEYTASLDWKSGSPEGTQLGASGYYCVYNGTESGFTINNLKPNTSYTFQAFEYTAAPSALKYLTTTASNNPASRTTNALSKPTVTTDIVTNILSNKAICGGTIPDSGGVAITDKGLVWSISPNPTTASLNKLSFGGNGTAFSDFMKGLSPSTKYYVKAYAVNSFGTSYGIEREFTTAVPAPVLITIPGSLDFGENYYGSAPLTISYNLKGENLSPSSGNITVTAPAGFLVSLRGNTGFAQSITVPYTGGKLNNVAIYAQLPATQYGLVTGNITHSGGGVAVVDADIVKVSGSIVQSQEELTNRGTDFWLGFGFEENMDQKSGSSSEAKLSLYLSAADLPAQVIVDLPGIPGAVGFPKTINVPANGIVEVTGFPTGDTGNSLNPGNFPDTRLYSTGVSDKGIHVYSTNGVPIAAWMHTYANNNSAAGAMLFPSNTWSSEYVVQAYGGYSNNDNQNSFFFVIANEDDTEIEFTPSNDILSGAPSSIFTENHTDADVLYKKGTTYKLTLNKGQVFNAMGVIKGTGTGIGSTKANGLDLTGTKIKTTCDKKIAVFGGNGRVLVTSPSCVNSAGSDNLIQQMFPTVAWGTKYLTMPTKNMEMNLFRVVVSDPTTVVKKDGVVLNPSTLINNLYYEVESNKPISVESDKPINLTQFILVGGACSFNIGEGDPEMIILSPVQQAIKKATVYSATIKKATNKNGHYINVIIDKKAITNQSFKLDNIDFNSATKVDVGGAALYSSSLILMKDAFKVHPQDPNYYYAAFKVAYGVSHTISSDYEFNAIAYGMGDGESYGYNAGTAIKNLNSIKIAVNPDGVDTSSTVVRTGKNNPVKLRIALPHNPSLVDKITWNAGSDARISPTGSQDGELDASNKAKYDGTIELDGRTFYVYTSPVSYNFSEEGIYKIIATATGTFASSCQGEDVQNISVVVGRDNINFDFTTTCGNPNISFINNTTAMPGTTITSWAWDFGDGGTSNLKDPVPHTYDIAKGYKYTVKLTTTNSVGTLTTDSLKIDFSGGIETKFTMSANDVCAGTKVSFDPSSTSITGTTSGTAESWTWDFGEGTPVVITGATSPTQEHTYLTAGKFYVKLTLKTTQGCENTYTDSVLVGSAPTSLIEAPLVSCFGDSVKYVDKSSIDFGEVVSWSWTFDDGTTSTLQNPSHKWLTAGNHKATLTVVSRAGCPAINIAEHTVNVLPLPTAAFTVSSPLCAGTEVIFTDTSTPNTISSTISELVWDFGDGSAPVTKTVSETVNHTFVAGTFKVKLTIKNAAGCIGDVLEKTIVINPIPEPDFTFSEVCVPNGKATFSGSNKNATTISTWAWDFGDGQTGTGQNPIHNYSAGGVYKVTLTATNSFGCPVSITKDVTVYDAPNTSFEVSNINGLCGDAPVQITDRSVVNGYGTISKLEIYWDYVNNPIQVITHNAPTANEVYINQYPLPTSATKNYRILIRSYTATGCFTESFQNVVLNAVPVAVLKTFNPICEEADAFSLTGGSEQSNLAGTGVYTGAGVGAGGQFSPANAGPGTHRITYTYTTSAGCISSAEQDIVVNPTPDVSFRNQVIYVKDRQSSALTPYIAKGDNLTYRWSPSTYLSDPNIANPVCTPINDIQYTVTVTSTSGCTDTAKITVNLLREILAPNTFTPNGDGVNDVWDILYFDTYPGATLEVFNRYGKKLFNSTVSNMPWDGRFKGEDLPVGTYYYIIDPKNGTKAITGAVTIVR